MDFDIEQIFHGWRIEQCIGTGAFGKVYKIVREDFGYTYEAALKVISIPQNQSEVDAIRSEGLSEDEVTEYFESLVEELVREFVLLSKLKGNSNIVSYEDHAVVKKENSFGWELYIRMELLTPLVDYLKTHKMTTRDVVRLGIDICHALEICQKYNIIHRDIKPENIFVSDINAFKLGDFGIARQLERAASALSKKGTVTYMAPEVYAGKEYNPTVDLYSLGIVLYRYLNNGRSPFLPAWPEKVRQTDMEQASVMRMGGGHPLASPCHADGMLSQIVLKACAYHPEERYTSAEEMRMALESALNTADSIRWIYPVGDVAETSNTSVDAGDRTEAAFAMMPRRKPEASGVNPAPPPISETGTSSINPVPPPVSGIGTTGINSVPQTVSGTGTTGINPAPQSISGTGTIGANPAPPPISGTETIGINPIPLPVPEPEEDGWKKKKTLLLVSAIVILLTGGILLAFAVKSLTSDEPDMETATTYHGGSSGSRTPNRVTDVAPTATPVTTEPQTEPPVETEPPMETEPPVEMVKIPAVKKLSKAEAVKRIKAAGLKAVTTTAYSDTVASGKVIRQKPQENKEVKKDSEVTIVVSKGVEKVSVPKVSGLTSSRAKERLKKAKLKWSVRSVYSSSVSEGRVISQSKKSGTKVKKKTVITIVVSLGRKPVTVTPAPPAPTPRRVTPKVTPKPKATPKPKKDNPDIDATWW